MIFYKVPETNILSGYSNYARTNEVERLIPAAQWTNTASLFDIPESARGYEQRYFGTNEFKCIIKNFFQTLLFIIFNIMLLVFEIIWVIHWNFLGSNIQDFFDSFILQTFLLFGTVNVVKILILRHLLKPVAQKKKV